MKIFILFVFVVLSLNNIYPQNAVYDAGLIKKNKQYYTDKIESILNLIKSDNIFEKYFKGKEDELKNLKCFLENPFIDTIKNLNINVLSDFKYEIENLKSKLTEYQYELKVLEKRNTDLKNNIEKIQSYIPDNIRDNQNITNKIKELNDEITKINEKIEKSKSDTSGQIKKQNSDTTDYKNILKAKKDTLKLYNEYKSYNDESGKNKISIDSLNEKIEKIQPVISGDYSKFEYNLKEAEPLSVLGKSNMGDITQSSANTNFKISESVAIDVIFNTISEQMATGLVNLLFEEILDNKIVFKGKNDSKVIFNVKKELNVFFPETISFLSNNNNYNLNKLNNSLRKSFDFDLRNILVNITNETTSPNYDSSDFFKKIRDNKKGIFNYLKIGITLMDALKNNFHPSEVISILSEANFLENDTQLINFQKYLSIIDVLQKNLRDTTSTSSSYSNVWINFDKLEKLLKIEDENTPSTSSSAYFVASLYHQLKKNKSDLADSFYKYFEIDNPSKLINKLKGFNKTVKSILLELNTLENNIKAINKNPDNVYAFYTYLDNLKGIITCLKDSDSLIKVFSGGSEFENIKKSITEISKYIEIPLSIFKSTQTGDYYTVVPQIIRFFTMLDKENANNDGFKEIIKYTDFAVDITNAKSQDDLSNAVRKAVGKYGGRARKEANDIVLSINSYPGIGGMMEIVNGEKGYGAFNPGLSVPLGINLQLWKKINFALFFQVFDLTAVANFHLKKGDQALPETVTFDQIFSPGFFLSFQIGKGLGFNLGASYTPKLRSLDNTDINNSKSLRYGVNFVYDVPLWHIY